MAQPGTPRLLETVSLSLPLSLLEPALFDWANRQGRGAVFSIDQLRALRQRTDALVSKTDSDRHLVMDLQLAIGAHAAHLHAPGEGWPAYLTAWQEQLLTKELGLCNELDQLRGLQDRFGGILLNGRSAPFVLLIPCRDGRWVQMGWNTIALLSGTPLDPEHPPRILEQHQAGSLAPALVG